MLIQRIQHGILYLHPEQMFLRAGFNTYMPSALAAQANECVMRTIRKGLLDRSQVQRANAVIFLTLKRTFSQFVQQASAVIFHSTCASWQVSSLSQKSIARAWFYHSSVVHRGKKRHFHRLTRVLTSNIVIGAIFQIERHGPDCRKGEKFRHLGHQAEGQQQAEQQRSSSVVRYGRLK